MAHAAHPCARLGCGVLWIGPAGGSFLTLLCSQVEPSPFGPGGQLLTLGAVSPATLVSCSASARPSSHDAGLLFCRSPAFLPPFASAPALFTVVFN